ncbi:MAG: BREX system P-loop protein BrxC, partial [Oscillospiraceae bacterium]|nr:BREX system P-loop protein BrxC [Oscillospiraceae bacterium]
EYALVPFYRFYDTVHTFLESSIRRVIDRCQNAADNNDGIEQYDVNILKLLYLVRYVEDIKANVENISILMADDIRTDKLSTKPEIQKSLDRLVSQNYVSRAGDTYTFLTDDEQDIAREIKNTPVDSANITKAISDIIFGKLFVSKKFKYDKYDFPYDQRIDETVIGQLTGSVALHFITAASEIYTTDDSAFLMKSQAENEVIIVLAETQPYFKELEDAMKIRNYVKSKNVAQLPEMIQNIIRGRQNQASAHEKRAEELITAAIAEGRIYAAGDKLTMKTSSVKDRIETAMRTLIESVYTKLSYIVKFYDSDAAILDILKGDDQVKAEGFKYKNPEAVKELRQYLEIQKIKQLPTSMGDIQKHFQAIPYGWREIEIAAVTAELIAEQTLSLKYSGAVIQPTDRKMPDYLRKRTEIDKAIISFRVAPNPELMKKARTFMSEYLNCTLGAIPDDEDGLIAYITEKFDNERSTLNDLLTKEYSREGYPGRNVVENGVKLCGDLLAQKSDNIALLKKAVDMQDDFLDHADDMSEVNTFFRVQRAIFDNAKKQAALVGEEKEYFRTEDDALAAVSAIKEIITLPKPYKRISELPELIQRVQDSYNKLLAEKREEINAEIQSAMGEIHQTADHTQTDIVQQADDALNEKRRAAEKAEKLTTLDAMKIQIANIRQQYLQKLVVVAQPTVDTVTMNRSTICYTMKLKSEADIDEYVAEIKKTLMDKLNGHDVLHII